MMSSRQGDKGVTEFEYACVFGFYCVSEKLFTRKNTMNSCWPVQTIFNCYNNERTLQSAMKQPYLAGETLMNFAKVAVYPVGDS